MRKSTIPIHGGAPHASAGAPVVTPITQSVSFVQALGTADGLKYARYGNTPNVELVERRLALLDGGEAAVALSSGMGATACAMLALLRPGDHLLSSSWIYGGTYKLFAEELRGFGIEVTLIDPLAPRMWRKALRQTTRAIFVESPVNPTCRVLDLASLANLAKAEGVALVVDSTFGSPINFRPLEHGADVVIHSTTKYLNGHHDALGGAVIGTSSYIEEVRRKMIVWGQAPDPFAVWLLERGMKTLDVRVRRQNENAQKLAEWCETRPEFARVLYPGLKSHPDHDIAQQCMDGFGGMMAVEVAGGGEAAERFLAQLEMVTHAPSLGGVDTLVSEPRYTSHASMTPEARAEVGIPDGFLRFSVGIEDVGDLIADFEQALR
ncbi:MAG TPA: aminotransferase class I/II-fold pyridoxal phosphate-dependent enzyme [Gemmatimonadaceae bacterium]|jgi:cystathionine beta-lyase/cystathionine gamma-synthase